MKIKLEFKPQDLWIGIFWKCRVEVDLCDWSYWDFWVCIIPMFPIHISFITKG